jgi:hypothetical protein
MPFLRTFLLYQQTKTTRLSTSILTTFRRKHGIQTFKLYINKVHAFIERASSPPNFKGNQSTLTGRYFTLVSKFDCNQGRRQKRVYKAQSPIILIGLDFGPLAPCLQWD